MIGLETLARDGKTKTEAARTLGTSRTTLARHAARAGVSFADGRTLLSRTLVDYRKTAMAMPLAEARDYLLEVLDYLVVPTPEYIDTEGLALTPFLSRLFHALRARDGGVVTQPQLMAACYGDRPDADWPNDQTVRVHVSRLRRALAEQAAPWRVENVRSFGYRLVRTTADA